MQYQPSTIPIKDFAKYFNDARDSLLDISVFEIDRIESAIREDQNNNNAEYTVALAVLYGYISNSNASKVQSIFQAMFVNDVLFNYRKALNNSVAIVDKAVASKIYKDVKARVLSMSITPIIGYEETLIQKFAISLIKKSVKVASVKGVSVTNAMVSKSVRNQALLSAIGDLVPEQGKLINQQIQQLDITTNNQPLQGINEQANQLGLWDYHKWLSNKPQDDPCIKPTGQVVKVGSKFNNGLTYPPVHRNCWANGQLVLSKRGWVKVEDVIVGDQLLSLDDRYNTIFAPVKYVWGKTVTQIYKLKSKTVDAEFTPEHKMVEMSDWDWKHNKSDRKFKYTQIKNCKNNYHNFLQSAYNDRVLEVEDSYVKFIAWYLSEGSKGIYRNGTKKQVSLSQSKEPNRSEMINDIQEFLKVFDPDAKLWIGKGLVVEIISDKLYDWLPNGKSYERRMPEWCLSLNIRQSRLLIDTFAKGDGTMTKGARYDGYLCADSMLLFTSSPYLFADLSVVLQNCEWSLSFTKRNEGWVQHHNGLYLTKHNCWCIRVKKSKMYYVGSKDISVIEGSFETTGIELEYGNKILSARNGKCLWTHNCYCRTVPVISKAHSNKLIKQYAK